MNTQRPNVIVITTDQQRCDSLSCYGSEFVDTPNLDRIGSEGAVFHRAYCANPVCTPARASIFSGQYLSRHGAWNVGVTVPEQTPMLSHYLGNAGYRTHYIGKAHLQAFGGGSRSIESEYEWEKVYAEWHGPYYGFETVELSLGHTTYGLLGHYGLWLKSQVSEGRMQTFRRAQRVGSGPDFGGEAYDWSMPEQLHSSVWTADRAVAFLEESDHRQPFLLAIGFQDPHHPHCVPTDFADRVSADTVELPRYEAGELDDKPPHFGLAREGKLEESRFRGAYPVAGQGIGFDFTKVSDKDAREGRAYYYSMVQLIDREVGRILDCLRRQGLAENTLVVFTTDHGELLGDHGLWMKGPFHYEELVRIPLLARWPKGIQGGQAIHSLASQVDIVPTVLACLGMDKPAEVDGLDLLPCLQSHLPPRRDHVVVECVDDPNHLRLATIVTEDRKLTYYFGEDFGELYDLARDPGEVQNRWDNAEYQGDRARLIAKVADHLERLQPRAERYSYA